jgi:two-component system, OmpR family, sensor histidine kinase SenX3
MTGAMVAAIEINVAGPVLVAVGIGTALLLVVLVLLYWRARRGLVRRVADVALRLEDHPPSVEHRSLDKNLTRVERAVETAGFRRDETATESARLVRALQGIPQGVVICDETGRVVFRNEAAEGFASARHAEVLVAAALDEMLQEALQGKAETRSLDLFGPPRRTLMVTTTPLDDERRTVGGLAVIDDVSERRRLEAVRRDFVANISHELKTPVGALALLAETLVDEDDAAVVRRLAERMQAEAFRVGRTIDDLLELSRIEAGEAPAQEPVAAHLVVAEAVERIRPAAEQRGIQIKVTEPRRNLSIRGDRRQLVSALYNLLDNAVKYSDAGSEVEVTGTVGAGRIRISVRDHGLGIPGRDLERIFERFYRVDRARSRETGGTGLGLAIVRHVATNHDGDVEVESHEGEGSTFTLVLPAAPDGAATVDTTEQTRAG